MIKFAYHKLAEESKTTLNFLDFINKYHPLTKDSLFEVIENEKAVCKRQIERNLCREHVEAAKDYLEELDNLIEFVTEKVYIDSDN